MIKAEQRQIVRMELYLAVVKCCEEDHIGSTTLITNESGEVVQRVEYLPTGETFIEQQDTCRGYVGIQGTAKELISLGKFFQEYIKAKGNSMKINFQIPNNSNYGNNEKANSNIGQ